MLRITARRCSRSFRSISGRAVGFPIQIDQVEDDVDQSIGPAFVHAAWRRLNAGTAGSAAAGGSASTIGLGANSIGKAGTSSTVGGAGSAASMAHVPGSKPAMSKSHMR